MIKNGFPAYTTQVGWLGYPDEKIRTLSKHFIERGFTAFKMKVGSDLEDDKRRLRFVENGHSFKKFGRHFVLPTDPLDSTLNTKNRIVWCRGFEPL